jgi:hypothetical protein
MKKASSFLPIVHDAATLGQIPTFAAGQSFFHFLSRFASEICIPL